MPLNRGDPALLQAIAAELRARRSALGISQEELAHRAGLNRTYVAKLETAQNQPSLGIFIALADGLGAEPTEVLTKVLMRRDTERRRER